MLPLELQAGVLVFECRYHFVLFDSRMPIEGAPPVPSTGNPGKARLLGNLHITEEEWQIHPKSWKGPQHKLPRSVPFVNGQVERFPPDEQATSAFRKLQTVHERRTQLQRWFPGVDCSVLAEGGLEDSLAETMVENTVQIAECLLRRL